MTSVHVLAPCPGRLVALANTSDPVFASEMVGPGVAIDPDPGEVTVVSPIAGKVVKVHPHAFVVLGADGVGVLVHLGINTVRLEGKDFILGKSLTLADFSVGACFSYADASGLPWSDYAQIRAWCGRLGDIPAWKNTAPRPG